MEGWEAAFDRANVADITRVDIQAQHDSANHQDRRERRRHCLGELRQTPDNQHSEKNEAKHHVKLIANHPAQLAVFTCYFKRRQLR